MLNVKENGTVNDQHLQIPHGVEDELHLARGGRRDPRQSLQAWRSAKSLHGHCADLAARCDARPAGEQILDDMTISDDIEPQKLVIGGDVFIIPGTSTVLGSLSTPMLHLGGRGRPRSISISGSGLASPDGPAGDRLNHFLKPNRPDFSGS